MNGGTLALIIAGLVAFLAGAYVAATGDRSVGIALMAMGLVFLALSLRQIRLIKKDTRDAG